MKSDDWSIAGDAGRKPFGSRVFNNLVRNNNPGAAISAGDETPDTPRRPAEVIGMNRKLRNETPGTIRVSVSS